MWYHTRQILMEIAGSNHVGGGFNVTFQYIVIILSCDLLDCRCLSLNAPVVSHTRVRRVERRGCFFFSLAL